jgi:hypothetical protein
MRRFEDKSRYVMDVRYWIGFVGKNVRALSDRHKCFKNAQFISERTGPAFSDVGVSSCSATRGGKGVPLHDC